MIKGNSVLHPQIANGKLYHYYNNKKFDEFTLESLRIVFKAIPQAI